MCVYKCVCVCGICAFVKWLAHQHSLDEMLLKLIASELLTDSWEALKGGRGATLGASTPKYLLCTHPRGNPQPTALQVSAEAGSEADFFARIRFWLWAALPACAELGLPCPEL